MAVNALLNIRGGAAGIKKKAKAPPKPAKKQHKKKDDTEDDDNNEGSDDDEEEDVAVADKNNAEGNDAGKQSHMVAVRKRYRDTVDLANARVLMGSMDFQEILDRANEFASTGDFKTVLQDMEVAQLMTLQISIPVLSKGKNAEYLMKELYKLAFPDVVVKMTEAREKLEKTQMALQLGYQVAWSNSYSTFGASKFLKEVNEVIMKKVSATGTPTPAAASGSRGFFASFFR